MFKLLAVLACAIACTAAMSCVALADETYFFVPSQDSWVNEASPDAGYGANTYLTVRDRSGLAEVFLRFDQEQLEQLSGLAVSAASLCMYQYQGTYSPGDAINLHAVTGPWDEATLTWQNKPAYAQEVLSSLSLTEGTQGWRQWDGLVISALCNGIVLENNRDGVSQELFARFYSSEYTDPSLRPYLKVSANSVTTTPEPVSMILFGLGSTVLGAKKLLAWRK